MPRGTSWSRLLAEGAAVVVSILIAFAIDASWEARGERRQAEEVLVSLEVDVASARERLEELDRQNRRVLAAADTMEQLISRGQGVIEVPLSVLFWLTVAPTYDPSGGALEAVVSSGQLATIEDSELQAALAEWPAAVADLDEKSRLHEAFVYEELIPELRGIMPFRAFADLRWDPNRDDTETLPLQTTPELVELLGHLRLMALRTLYSGGGMERVQLVLTRVEDRLAVIEG